MITVYRLFKKSYVSHGFKALYGRDWKGECFKSGKNFQSLISVVRENNSPRIYEILCVSTDLLSRFEWNTVRSSAPTFGSYKKKKRQLLISLWCTFGSQKVIAFVHYKST